jgi:hypothetical protein
MMDAACQADTTYRFDLAAALVAANQAKQNAATSAQVWGYGNKSCVNYVDDRAKQSFLFGLDSWLFD